MNRRRTKFILKEAESGVGTKVDLFGQQIRARGCNLFSNAIATSDLRLDFLTAADNASFNFFAPTDSSLFALAMNQPASASISLCSISSPFYRKTNSTPRPSSGNNTPLWTTNCGAPVWNNNSWITVGPRGLEANNIKRS